MRLVQHQPGRAPEAVEEHASALDTRARLVPAALLDEPVLLDEVELERVDPIGRLARQTAELLVAGENWYGLATLDAILGDVEAAIGYLRQAALEENINRQWARIDPDLASIRDDPRFDEIVGH